MIQLIYRLCPACLGLGEVEPSPRLPRNPNNLLDKPEDNEITNDCYVCHGDGYIPTGDFTLSLSDPLVSPSVRRELIQSDIKRLPENIRKTLINRK